MASEGLFLGCWTPATLRTFQVPLRPSQHKVKAFYTRVGALADLKISKACRNIYRRIFSGGVIAWHGRNDLRDTTGLPFANLTRIDRNVRAPAVVTGCARIPVTLSTALDKSPVPGILCGAGRRCAPLSTAFSLCRCNIKTT